MAKTVAGLMENAAEAQQVVQELIADGIDRSNIGVMASGAESGLPVEAAPDSSVVGASGLKGAGTGAVFGGLTGLLAELAGLAIPGVGPVIAAGPIATALAGGGIGAVAGGAISALTSIGVPEEETQYYTDGLRRGGVLVTVYAEDANMAERSVEIMRRHHVVDVNERAMPVGDREETGAPVSASVGIMAANEINFDPTGTPGLGYLENDERLTAARLAALDVQGGNRRDDAAANASLELERAGRALADEPETTNVQRSSSGSSDNRVDGESVRQPASADASADNAESLKPPKAHHAKANAVLAAARFVGSERRRAGASPYTGIERRAS